MLPPSRSNVERSINKEPILRDHSERATQAADASAARLWPPIARFIAREQALGNRAAASGVEIAAFYEFLRFGVKQAWACLFGALLLGLIIGTKLWYPPHAMLARYDALVLGAVAIQIGLIAFRLETWEEVRIILIFHVAGTVMELFKTSVGSWIYPEPNLLRIGGVPLYSGFMYAAIGSYLARAWRLFDFRFTHHPRLWAISALAASIYANFFTHHYLPDMRLLLLAATALLFGRTTVYFKVWREYRRMPLLLGFVLVALFIWFAENIGTGMGAWIYPSQARQWAMVPFSKLEAWFLLMIVSYALTALVNRPSNIAPQALDVGRRLKDGLALAPEAGA
jgi:uncharacterized membrane protein YoaT (DUF817 family)